MRLLAHGDPRLYPVLELLGGDQGWDLVLAGNAVGQRLRSSGISFNELESFLTEPLKIKVARAVPAYFERIAGAWQEIAGSARGFFEGSDLIVQSKERLERTLRESLIEEMLLIEAFKACHAERPLTAVCLPDDFPRPFFALTRAAQRYGVPVLHVAHGVYFHDEGRKLVANAIAVGGWFNKLSLPALGFDPGRIFVTGNPAWDHYSRLPALLPPASEIKRELGLAAQTPLILYGTTWSDNRDWLAKLRRGFTAVAAALELAGLEAAHLVVKLHPFGDGDASAYAQAAASQGLANVTFTNSHKELLLWAADLVVVETASSLMVESTLLRRPVIVLMNEEEKSYLFGGIGYPGDALLTCPPTPAVLASSIADLLSDGRLAASLRSLVPATIEKFNLANDGQAARRVGTLLARLARSVPASPA